MLRRLSIVLIVAFLLVWARSRVGASPALCLLSGNISQIWGLASSTTGANVRITYQGITGPQNPIGSGGSIVSGGSRCSVYTDVNGNLPASGACTSFLQGAILYVTIGDGQPTRVQIPFNTTADLSTLILANTDPPGLISSISIAAGGSYVLNVTNPAPGTVGVAVLSPGNVTGFNPSVCTSGYPVVGQGNNNAVTCTPAAAVDFSANGNSSAGVLAMSEDSSGDFTFALPSATASIGIVQNIVGAASLTVTNNNPATAAIQAAFYVSNTGTSPDGGFAVIGQNGNFGTPYLPNTTYVNSDAGPLLLYSAVANQPIKLAAGGEGSVGTLNITEDAGGNFAFAPPGGANMNITAGKNSSNVTALSVVDTQNGTGDILEVFPQNLTVGVGVWFNGIRAIGSNGNNTLELDGQGGGNVFLNVNNSSGTVDVAGHLLSSLSGATAPTIFGGASSSNCGSTASITANSTDVSGGVTVSGSVTSNTCIISFGTSWGSIPSCSAMTTGGVPELILTTPATGSLVATFNNSADVATFRWMCIGNS